MWEDTHCIVGRTDEPLRKIIPSRGTDFMNKLLHMCSLDSKLNNCMSKAIRARNCMMEKGRGFQCEPLG